MRIQVTSVRYTDFFEKWLSQDSVVCITNCINLPPPAPPPTRGKRAFTNMFRSTSSNTISSLRSPRPQHGKWLLRIPLAVLLAFGDGRRENSILSRFVKCPLLTLMTRFNAAWQRSAAASRRSSSVPAAAWRRRLADRHNTTWRGRRCRA